MPGYVAAAAGCEDSADDAYSTRSRRALGEAGHPDANEGSERRFEGPMFVFVTEMATHDRPGSILDSIKHRIALTVDPVMVHDVLSNGLTAEDIAEVVLGLARSTAPTSLNVISFGVPAGLAVGLAAGSAPVISKLVVLDGNALSPKGQGVLEVEARDDDPSQRRFDEMLARQRLVAEALCGSGAMPREASGKRRPAVELTHPTGASVLRRPVLILDTAAPDGRAVGLELWPIGTGDLIEESYHVFERDAGDRRRVETICDFLLAADEW